MNTSATAAILDALLARTRSAVVDREPRTTVLDGPLDGEFSTPDVIAIGADAGAPDSDSARADREIQLGGAAQDVLDVSCSVMSWSGGTNLPELRLRAFALVDIVASTLSDFGEDVPGVWDAWLAGHSYRPMPETNGLAAVVDLTVRLGITNLERRR